jgi:hopanoid C-2 methylase
MHKDHNMMVPIMEAIKTLNDYGMEVVSGIILGLDTDKPETGQALLDFIDASQIPLLTINLLQALPQTPLWDRLKRENRLIEDEGRDSNVDFRLPYEDVVTTWRACMGSAYQPGKLLERFEFQIRETYPHRITLPASKERASWRNIRLGLIMLRNIFWKVGVLGDYKLEFWKFAFRRLARGEIEYLISSILVAHHLIMFARAASVGQQNASNYSMRLREASVPAE